MESSMTPLSWGDLTPTVYNDTTKEKQTRTLAEYDAGSSKGLFKKEQKGIRAVEADNPAEPTKTKVPWKGRTVVLQIDDSHVLLMNYTSAVDFLRRNKVQVERFASKETVSAAVKGFIEGRAKELRFLKDRGVTRSNNLSPEAVEEAINHLKRMQEDSPPALTHQLKPRVSSKRRPSAGDGRPKRVPAGEGAPPRAYTSPMTYYNPSLGAGGGAAVEAEPPLPEKARRAAARAKPGKLSVDQAQSAPAPVERPSANAAAASLPGFGMDRGFFPDSDRDAIALPEDERLLLMAPEGNRAALIENHRKTIVATASKIEHPVIKARLMEVAKLYEALGAKYSSNTNDPNLWPSRVRQMAAESFVLDYLRAGKVGRPTYDMIFMLIKAFDAFKPQSQDVKLMMLDLRTQLVADNNPTKEQNILPVYNSICKKITEMEKIGGIVGGPVMLYELGQLKRIRDAYEFLDHLHTPPEAAAPAPAPAPVAAAPAPNPVAAAAAAVREVELVQSCTNTLTLLARQNQEFRNILLGNGFGWREQVDIYGNMVNVLDPPPHLSAMEKSLRESIAFWAERQAGLPSDLQNVVPRLREFQERFDRLLYGEE